MESKSNIFFADGGSLRGSRLCQPRLTAANSPLKQHPLNQVDSDEEIAIPNSVSCTVSEPSSVAETKVNACDHIKKDELHKPPVVYIWFRGLGCCRTIKKYISLDHDMDESGLIEHVRNKLHLACEDAEAKIEFVSRTTQQTEWTIPSKQGNESCWLNYREGLFERRNEKGIYGDVDAVVTCSVLCQFICEKKRWLDIFLQS